MYSLVLAALLTTGTEVPDWGCRGGCHGCRGCWGGCGGCWGGCGGCWGGCYGCWGGGYGCGGCWGGCYGCGGGCWGGCYGCYGGCWGGCYGCGGGMVIMSGCCGGAAAGGGAAGGGAAGGGAAGGGGAGGAGRGGQASQGGGGGGGSSETSLQDLKKSVDELKKGQSQMRIDALKITAEELRRKETDQRVDELRREINEMRLRVPPPPPGAAPPPPKNRRELPNPQPGKVYLDMPAEAVVFVNDTRIESASSYLTQPLEPGKEYVLNIEAVVARDGQSVNRVKQLTIRAGEEARLAYQDMGLADGRWSTTGGSAGAPAQITVRLPADARLSVHGVDCPLTSDTRTFDTPALESGQKYYYLLKAEIVRDGRTIAQTKRIDFRSGERVTVAFDDLGTNVVTAR